MLNLLPTFSATKLDYYQLDLLQLQIKASSVDDSTVTQYTKTLDSFLHWIAEYGYSPTANTALHWCTYLASTRALAAETLDAYISHLQYFADLGLLPQMRASSQRRFFKGLKNIRGAVLALEYLPPSLVLRIFMLDQTTLMMDAILFQAFTGLRAGQMLLVTPEHIPDLLYHIMPPFKHTRATNMMPLHHVPAKIVTNFLRHAKDKFAPVIPMTAQAYKANFVKTMKSLDKHLASHAARRFFATYQHFLHSSINVIGNYMLHVNPKKTTVNYVGELPAAEANIILQHPEIFIPLSSALIVTTGVPARINGK